jgi:hypothetical protein
MFSQNPAEVDALLAGDESLLRLPVKQALEAFIRTCTDIVREDFVSLSASAVLDEKIVIPKLNHLKAEFQAAGEQIA